jgi:fructose/tagatose bisphosphate aldolase
VEFIRDGYTTVMFDGPTLPPEQNLALTQDVVRVARPAGVNVEAEVGTIGTTAEYGAEIENPHLADPAACEAMGETRIDALAVRSATPTVSTSPSPKPTSTSLPKSDAAPTCH